MSTPDTRALIEECVVALSEELSAWDIDPPLHHVKQAHDKCVAWLASPPPAQPAQPEPTVEMVTAYLDANDAYWKRTDALPAKAGVWRSGTPREATLESLRAALAAQPKEPTA